MLEIFESSERAKAHIVESEITHHKFVLKRASKYPFNELHVGKSFCLDFDSVRESTIRNASSQFSKRSGRKTIVIKHHNCFEIARVA